MIWKGSVGDIFERGLLHHAAKARSNRDPELLKVNRSALVGRLFRALTPDFCKWPIDRPHDVGDGDLVGRSSESVAAVGAT